MSALPKPIPQLGAGEVLESLAAAMSGLTVEEYRQQSKMAREGYKRIVELAAQIRREREEKEGWNT